MFSTTARLARDAHRVVSRNGEFAVYMLSFSEARSVKQPDGSYKKEYTNYSASVMAKIDGPQDGFYGQMLVKGNVIGISAENIYPESREYDGKVYLEIKLDNSRLSTVVAALQRDPSHSGGNGQQQQQQQNQQRQSSGQNSGNQQQRQQQSQQQNQQRNEPPMDFDDDIPF